MPSAELAGVVEMVRKMFKSDEIDVASGRARLETAAAIFERPRDVRYQPIDANGVRTELVVAPGADAGRTLVYFHGGAYTAGSIGSHRALATELSRAARLRVLNVDYRLAPEHPHPAAVEDAVTVARFLWKQGVPPERIAFGGDSAGGGLVVAALVALRDAGDALPAAAVCLSPWTDLTLTRDSHTSRAAIDPMVRLPALAVSRDAYAAGRDLRSPTLSPLFASLAGLPPMLVQVGSAELLLDDSTELVANARRAGVDATLEVWDDMIHVFQAFFPMLPEGRDAIATIAAFLAARL
jgi:epsilon-lactone hydrolase